MDALRVCAGQFGAVAVSFVGGIFVVEADVDGKALYDVEVETESRADESVAGVFGVEHQTSVAEEHEVGVSADRNISFDVERQGNVDAVIVAVETDATTYEEVGVEADAVDVRDPSPGVGAETAPRRETSP